MLDPAPPRRRARRTCLVDFVQGDRGPGLACELTAARARRDACCRDRRAKLSRTCLGWSYSSSLNWSGAMTMSTSDTACLRWHEWHVTIYYAQRPTAPSSSKLKERWMEARQPGGTPVAPAALRVRPIAPVAVLWNACEAPTPSRTVGDRGSLLESLMQVAYLGVHRALRSPRSWSPGIARGRERPSGGRCHRHGDRPLSVRHW